MKNLYFCNGCKALLPAKAGECPNCNEFGDIQGMFTDEHARIMCDAYGFEIEDQENS